MLSEPPYHCQAENHKEAKCPDIQQRFHAFRIPEMIEFNRCELAMFHPSDATSETQTSCSELSNSQNDHQQSIRQIHLYRQDSLIKI